MKHSTDRILTTHVGSLPRPPELIELVRAKLRGEMPDDLMYGCAGDRPFLSERNMNLPGFLKLVRDSGDNDRAIIDAVKRSASGR